MFELLKSEAMALRVQTIFLKEKERHYLENARWISGKFKKKHNKNENKIEIPDIQVELVLELTEGGNLQKLVDRDYEKYWGLTHYRKNIVRKFARDVHLALAFLRGTPALKVERFKKENPDWSRIEEMVVAYGEDDPRILLQKLAEWRDAGDFPPVGKRNKSQQK